MKIFSSIRSLQEHYADTSNEDILLSGDLVFVTHSKEVIENLCASPDSLYVQQPPRPAGASSIFSKEKSFLYSALLKEALECILDNGKKRVGLLIDQHLAFGASQKRECAIISGGESDFGLLNLEILIFDKNGHLLLVAERNISNTPDGLRRSFSDLIEDDIPIFWMYPLPDPPMMQLTEHERFKMVDDSHLKSIIWRKLYRLSGHKEELWGWQAPASLAALFVLIYVTAFAFSWNALERARSEFAQEIKGYEETYRESAQSLDLLRHRELLLKETPEQVARLQHLNLLIAEMAKLKDVLIRSVTFFAESDGQRPIGVDGNPLDFVAEMEVPQEPGKSARDSAESLLSALNQKARVNVHLISHNKAEIVIGEQRIAYWSYSIGGTRH